ncbi:5444_t:CDS:1, partial [Funneliformis caledonium]
KKMIAILLHSVLGERQWKDGIIPRGLGDIWLEDILGPRRRKANWPN